MNPFGLMNLAFTSTGIRSITDTIISRKSQLYNAKTISPLGRGALEPFRVEVRRINILVLT